MCTPSTLLFHLTVFLFASQFAVYLTFLWYRTGTEAMSQWSRLCVTVQLWILKEEKTWTTVRRTMITIERGHDHQELLRGFLRFEVVGD